MTMRNPYLTSALFSFLPSAFYQLPTANCPLPL